VEFQQESTQSEAYRMMNQISRDVSEDQSSAGVGPSNHRTSGKPLVVLFGVLLLVIWFFVCAWRQFGGYSAIGFALRPLLLLGLLWQFYWWRYVTRTVWLPIGLPLLCIYVWIRIVGTRSLLRDCLCVLLAYVLGWDVDLGHRNLDSLK
jgi:hypothetical protein